MFDKDTSKLIAAAPSLDGLDHEDLPKRLTNAYTSIVSARIRLRELAQAPSISEDAQILVREMQRLAFANEAFVSAAPERENRASAAFVAGAAHHVSLMAKRVSAKETVSTRLLINSISPEVSATLLFLIAEATADAAEMAKAISLPDHDSIERRVLVAITDLAKGDLKKITEIDYANIIVDASEDPVQSACTGLLYLLLTGLTMLANELLGLEPTTRELIHSTEIFTKVKNLCTQNIEVPQNFYAGSAISAYTGPRHLATLMLCVAKDLAPAAIVSIEPPNGPDAGQWTSMMKSIALRRPFLWRNHRSAVDSGYLKTGISSVVSFPTGAGKSTLSELKIASVLLSGKKVVFLAPTLALVEQTAKALKETFPLTAVERERGNPSLENEATIELPAISVMTTERCLSLLGYKQENFSEVGLLVFDECHLLHPGKTDKSRRAIDAMLCVLNFVFAAPSADLLLLSAMMKNTDEIANWIETVTERRCLALSLTWKPTRQVRGCVVYEADRIEELKHVLNTARAESTTKSVPAAIGKLLTAKPKALFSLQQTWISKERDNYLLLPLLDKEIPLSTSKNWYLTPNGNEVAGELAMASANQGLKTLVFVQTVPLAISAMNEIRLKKQGPPIKLNASELEWLEDTSMELGDFSYSYISMNESGEIDSLAVCHHALLLPSERYLHESLFKRRDGVNIMIATSTLAQGMNLPSEVVIIGGDSRFEDKANKLEQLEAHELLNAAGRAGRAGESSYGFVLVVPSKVVHFQDGNNEIHNHWNALQTIFAQSDQCVSIDDPLTALIDEMQIASQDQSTLLKYFISRLPVGNDDDIDKPARLILGKSLAAYRAKAANNEAQFNSSISAILAARKINIAANNLTWMDRLAAATGVPVAVVSVMHTSLKDVNFPDFSTMSTWLNWTLKWFEFYPQLFTVLMRDSTLSSIFGEKVFNDLQTDHARGAYALSYLEKPLHLWMAGATLSDIELAMGTKPGKIGNCNNARKFVLKLVPEIAFAFSLPLSIIVARKTATGDMDIDLPGLGLETLSSCIREGFDVPEKLALRAVLKGRLTRVAVHREFELIRSAVTPPLGPENIGGAMSRIREARTASKF